MSPIAIKGQTRNLGKPSDWDEASLGPCESLPIRDENYGSLPAMVSAWKPTSEELNLLNNGYAILLHVVSASHPPVSLSVSNEE